MPAAPAAPPPSAAPAQPAQSAPAPAAKALAVAAKPAPAPQAKSGPSKAPPAPAKAEAAKPVEPPKELNTLDEAFSGIRKLAGVPAEDLLGEEPSVQEEEKPQPDKQDATETNEDEAQVTDKEDEVAKEPEPEDPKLGKRPSPWKLVEHYKGLNTNLQREIAELRGKSTNGEPPKEYTERYSALEKRNHELEQHMRFVDYSKSQEFVDKYQKPYEEAWAKAITGLKGLKVQFTDQSTQEVVARDLTPQDIAALANMEPHAARLEIKNRFPEDIAEVRGYVDRIRDLADAQNKALEEQRTKGGDWQKQQHEKAQAVQEANHKLWHQFSKEAQEKLAVLRPVEGDDERNMKLEKATAFVQKALASKANDPNLTDEQRAEVIKQHVSVRNRAIAYSVLVHENKALKAQLAEKEAALKAFEESAPTDGNGKGKPAPTGDLSIDGIASLLSKMGR